MTGYISVHRKIMDSVVWSDANYLKLWLYCLMKASHKDHETLVGNILVKLKRGQFVTGRKKLFNDLNRDVKPANQLSEKTWERYLKNLEKWQMLTIEVTNKYSIVTIANYEFYQSKDDKVDQESDQQLTNNCPSNDQQLTTNNNGNKGNKGNNKKPSSHKYEICDMENAHYLFEKMLENNPTAKKPNFEKWANDFRILRERDERTDKQIKYMIDWTQNDSFWQRNILSPSKLKTQWDRLVLSAKADHEKKRQKSKTVDFDALRDEIGKEIQDEQATNPGIIKIDNDLLS